LNHFYTSLVLLEWFALHTANSLKNRRRGSRGLGMDSAETRASIGPEWARGITCVGQSEGRRRVVLLP
jgi:hypothetical protein